MYPVLFDAKKFFSCREKKNRPTPIGKVMNYFHFLEHFPRKMCHGRSLGTIVFLIEMIFFR